MATKKNRSEVSPERVRALNEKINAVVGVPVVKESLITEKAIEPVQDIVVQELSVDDVREQVNKIQILMKSIMKPDEHYGIIPGTSNPTLYKAGAEKLCFTFRLVPEFEIKRNDLPNNHREYEIKCTLRNAVTGAVMGQGVGSCSTMEKKYRYRNDADFEVTDLPIPADSKEKKTEYRKQGFGMKKVDGIWLWVKYKGEKAVENPDIADTYNTVLKIGKKRAHVDATISTCAASDIFTQDIEDTLPENGYHAPIKNVTPRTEESPQSHTDEESQEIKDPFVYNLNSQSPNYGKKWTEMSTEDITKAHKYFSTDYKGADGESMSAILADILEYRRLNAEYDPKTNRYKA
jgi:hypothetical protein